MGALLDRLVTTTTLLSDGAWGTMLQQAGLAAGACPEAWNVDRPDDVADVARAYAQAGADIVCSNTFGGNRCKLAHHGLGDRVAELNAAGVRCSRQGAPTAVIMACVGPTGAFLEPYGEMEPEEMEAIFAEQIQALRDAGVDAICIETMSAVEEAACAIRAAKQVSADLDVAATMTFDSTVHGYRTMMGTTPADAARALADAGADIVGANCGGGPEQMVSILDEMRLAVSVPLLVHVNAGMPELVGGETRFRMQPEDMAGRLGDLVTAGARIIGGCCGTTPAHISALRVALTS
ncbi:MAG: homocysteine S-methyltransferase family protein [Planctomycetota bacterium]